MITAQAVPTRRADVILRPAAQVAPGAGAILLDTGPIGPSQVYVEFQIQASADANGATPELVHRNAGNAADLEVDPLPGGTIPSALMALGSAVSFSPVGTSGGGNPLWFEARARVLLATGERLLIRNLNAAAALESWQAKMDLWVL